MKIKLVKPDECLNAFVNSFLIQNHCNAPSAMDSFPYYIIPTHTHTPNTQRFDYVWFDNNGPFGYGRKVRTKK